MPSVIERGARTFRYHGFPGVAKAVARRLGGGRGRDSQLHYQGKTAKHLEERLALVRSAMPSDTRSVLDVGCNQGTIAARLAESGRWVLGVDNEAAFVEQAQERYQGVRNCAFMLMDVSPDNISLLPRFDVVLLLSVHHHWLMAHGPEVAGSMLRGIVERAERVLIFEGASRRVRYGDYPPDFVDNDEASVTAYLEKYINTYTSEVVSRVDKLGKAGCVGDREPYRWSYALVR